MYVRFFVVSFTYMSGRRAHCLQSGKDTLRPAGYSIVGRVWGFADREETLDSHRGQYRPVHEVQAKRMYFMVSDALL